MVSRKTSPILPPRLDNRRLEAGCDEVGRGCLAGPVVAAAVILPSDCYIAGLYDSKKLSEKSREEIEVEIRQYAIDFAVAFVSSEDIDRVNILQASFMAMRQAVRQLTTKPEHLLIDGNRFKSDIDLPPHTCIIRGDSKIGAIAAASILAKNARDRYMRALAKSYPQYDWEKNVGYPTSYHLEMLHKHGLTPHHRKSFAPCKKTLFDTDESVHKQKD